MTAELALPKAPLKLKSMYESAVNARMDFLAFGNEVQANPSLYNKDAVMLKINALNDNLHEKVGSLMQACLKSYDKVTVEDMQADSLVVNFCSDSRFDFLPGHFYDWTNNYLEAPLALKDFYMRAHLSAQNVRLYHQDINAGKIEPSKKMGEYLINAHKYDTYKLEEACMNHYMKDFSILQMAKEVVDFCKTGKSNFDYEDYLWVEEPGDNGAKKLFIHPHANALQTEPLGIAAAHCGFIPFTDLADHGKIFAEALAFMGTHSQEEGMFLSNSVECHKSAVYTNNPAAPLTIEALPMCRIDDGIAATGSMPNNYAEGTFICQEIIEPKLAETDILEI